jgi:hypothetical protein
MSLSVKIGIGVLYWFKMKLPAKANKRLARLYFDHFSRILFINRHFGSANFVFLDFSAMQVVIDPLIYVIVSG